MVGGGNTRDEGSLVIRNTNVFAALEILRKKKKKKTKGSSKEDSGEAKAAEQTPQVVWTPAPLNSKSWADEDDDDYYSTMAPIQPIWETAKPEPEPKPIVEESESEEDILDEGDEDEEEHETEAQVMLRQWLRSLRRLLLLLR